MPDPASTPSRRIQNGPAGLWRLGYQATDWPLGHVERDRAYRECKSEGEAIYAVNRFKAPRG